MAFVLFLISLSGFQRVAPQPTQQPAQQQQPQPVGFSEPQQQQQQQQQQPVQASYSQSGEMPAAPQTYGFPQQNTQQFPPTSAAQVYPGQQPYQQVGVTI